MNEEQTPLSDIELFDRVKAGVMQEMQSALTADIDPLIMHAVTQSYLLLQVFDFLGSIHLTLSEMRTTQLERRDQPTMLEEEIIGRLPNDFAMLEKLEKISKQLISIDSSLTALCLRD
jgi:hypothetical protein